MALEQLLWKSAVKPNICGFGWIAKSFSGNITLQISPKDILRSTSENRFFQEHPKKQMLPVW